MNKLLRNHALLIILFFITGTANAVDQCDTTSQCRTTFGVSATDCKNSRSNSSICMCGSDRCDRIVAPTPSPTPTPIPEPTPVPEPAPSPILADQCDSTQQCRNIFGSIATDCKNSRSNSSVCMCGNQRCDSISNPTPSPAPTSTPVPTPDVDPTPGTKRPGDAGVRFDTSKFDPDYPQMREWVKAGVRGGIPSIETQLQKFTVTLNGGDAQDIINAINRVANNGGGVVYLRNGSYNINRTVRLKSNVSIIGESRDGVIATIPRSMTANAGAFEMRDIRNAGIYRMHIRGAGNPPRYDWNLGINANHELRGNENISIFIKGSEDCWVTDVDIINSYDFPVRVSAKHITLRGLNVDGAHNKAGGAQGYFFILDGYNLITQNKVTHLRHISLQGDGVEYNVVYDNDFQQEVSFHAGDDGNNLVENNRIHLPADMPPANGAGGPDYRCVMGPWSSKHRNSRRANFLWKNDCIQFNHGGSRPQSRDDVVYTGPLRAPTKGQAAEDNWKEDTNIPRHGTLYPIILD
ncbi:hypothetical protein [Agarilytica rhodophyticola]|uniref:hypothetical protein n=1 Tax=Agarilytica rhodophyticola TaxID=1737490 RepID=UPI000B3483CD|nr:hypothetical protein [Agarilytica rhodophyticola]